MWILLLISLTVAGYEVWQAVRMSKWDGKTRFTVLDFRDSGVRLVSSEPDGEALEMELPKNMEIVTIGRGIWTAGAMRSLAEKYGFEWAAESVASHLGVPYTAVWQKMSVIDRAKWEILVWKKEIRILQLINSVFLVEKTATDGEKTLSLSALWNKRAGELFYSSAIAQNTWQLSVINGTSVDGLAAKVSRIAETQGFKVVSLVRDESDLEGCLVLGKEEWQKESALVWLVGYFGCDYVTGDSESDVIELRIGKKFVEWMGNGD